MNWLERKIVVAKVQKVVDNFIGGSKMSPTWKAWLTGAANAGISGLAVAAGSLAAGITLKQGAIMVGISVATSMVKWMSQHPLPGAPQ
jgi:hypothetical protein